MTGEPVFSPGNATSSPGLTLVLAQVNTTLICTSAPSSIIGIRISFSLMNEPANVSKIFFVITSLLTAPFAAI